MDLRTLRQRFRDEEQLSRAQRVVELRLADDRQQDECRYLMRFMWQLGMEYTEVTREELEAYVTAEKLSWVERLLAAVEQGHEAIDQWAIEAETKLPVLEDRGHAARS